MDAIVLCGGRGTRLVSVVSDVPKPLAPVGGRPFLDYVLSYLSQSKLVSRVVLATGHLAAKVETHYGASFSDLSIAYSPEIEPLGTGGAVFQAMRRFDIAGPFFILNGDSFVDAELEALVELLDWRSSNLAMTLFRVDNAARFGTVACDGLRVTGFAEKTVRTEPGLINAGIYAATRDTFGEWNQVNGYVSLEHTVFPALVRRGAVAAIQSGRRFIDIGLPETYAAAETFFAGG
ncbi:MAG: NTP transferase domain-containing protein [Betaproteobacteria bacterium]|nr:NTP transferase domain-containing protein [Betaproteobacteria bacterium]